MRRTVVALALVAGLAAAALPAVASGASARAPRALPSFYQVPKTLPSKVPGALIRSQSQPVAGLNGKAWLVMYVSQANKGKAVPVTGYVVVPNGPAPKGGWPVVAWDHGTNGMADVCAPSLAIGSSDVPLALINSFLAKKWAFVASDYQGEGTPGLMPYIVGASAAQDTVNLVKAALKVPGASTSKVWVDWGHSEGGQTAMFVDHIGATYGKGLHLKGVVAGAPPSQFSLLNAFLKTSPFAFYILMVAFGFNAYYGNTAAPLDAVLTPTAKAMLPDIATLPANASQCTSILASAVAAYVNAKNFGALQKADPYTVPAWKKLILANDPESFKVKSTVPLLIIQGGKDEQIPVVSTSILYNHLCGLGQVAQRWIYPNQSHAGVIAPSFNDMLKWIGDRFAGVSNPDPYVPVGQPSIVPAAQHCN